MEKQFAHKYISNNIWNFHQMSILMELLPLKSVGLACSCVYIFEILHNQKRQIWQCSTRLILADFLYVIQGYIRTPKIQVLKLLQFVVGIALDWLDYNFIATTTTSGFGGVCLHI